MAPPFGRVSPTRLAADRPSGARPLASMPVDCFVSDVEQLQPTYLSDMAAQLASLSAFLGGFAATFLATLLALAQQRRLMTVTVALSCLSAISFMIAVVAASMLGAMLHAGAPAILARASPSLPRGFMSLGFGVGIYSLLFAIGCSGWLRTRATGWTTTVISLVGAIIIGLLTVQVG